MTVVRLLWEQIDRVRLSASRLKYPALEIDVSCGNSYGENE